MKYKPSIEHIEAAICAVIAENDSDLLLEIINYVSLKNENGEIININISLLGKILSASSTKWYNTNKIYGTLGEYFISDIAVYFADKILLEPQDSIAELQESLESLIYLLSTPLEAWRQKKTLEEIASEQGKKEFKQWLKEFEQWLKDKEEKADSTAHWYALSVNQVKTHFYNHIKKVLKVK